MGTITFFRQSGTLLVSIENLDVKGRRGSIDEDEHGLMAPMTQLQQPLLV